VVLYLVASIVGNCAVFAIVSRLFSHETAAKCAWVFVKVCPVRKVLFVISAALALLTFVASISFEDQHPRQPPRVDHQNKKRQ
jgi:hypothetical protein